MTEGSGPRKDIWDKVGVVAGVLSSVLIAAFGLYFNEASKDSQRTLDELLAAQTLEIESNRARLQELQVVESMLPHLSGEAVGEDRKKLALIALRRLGNQELATEFAEVLGGAGAEAALKHTIATAETDEERARAEQALGRLTLGAGANVAAAGLDDILAGLDSLTGKTDHFAILEKPGLDQHYMQTIGGPERFTLEYREGGPDKHFQCDVDKAQLVAAFQAYAAEADESWRSVCDWKPLKLR